MLETARFKIKGMTCRNCERTIKKALLTKNGVKEVYLSRDTGMASVTYDAAQTDVPELFEVILRKGYFPGAAEE